MNSSVNMQILTIKDNHHTADGGAVYIVGGNITISNATITNNSVYGNGGGVCPTFLIKLANYSADISKRYYPNNTVRGFYRK